jgi:hypothetical protein
MILFSLTVAQIRLRLGEWDFSSESEPNPYMEQKAVKKVLKFYPFLSCLVDAFCVSLSVCLYIFPYACIYLRVLILTVVVLGLPTYLYNAYVSYLVLFCPSAYLPT